MLLWRYPEPSLGLEARIGKNGRPGLVRCSGGIREGLQHFPGFGGSWREVKRLPRPNRLRGQDRVAGLQVTPQAGAAVHFVQQAPARPPPPDWDTRGEAGPEPAEKDEP
jgi:hypothetical protein